MGGDAVPNLNRSIRVAAKCDGSEPYRSKTLQWTAGMRWSAVHRGTRRMRHKQSLGDCRATNCVQPADVSAFTPEMTFVVVSGP
jgi:hypothetical protein